MSISCLWYYTDGNANTNSQQAVTTQTATNAGVTTPTHFYKRAEKRGGGGEEEEGELHTDPCLASMSPLQPLGMMIMSLSYFL